MLKVTFCADEILPFPSIISAYIVYSINMRATVVQTLRLRSWLSMNLVRHVVLLLVILYLGMRQKPM
jgi:hypothetical protein